MIDAHSRVTLHFSLSVKPEGVTEDIQIDSTFDKQAASFVMGDGSLLPGFENKLLGLKAGDEKTFVLPASEAFGELNLDSIHDIEKRQFKSLELLGNELSEGLIVSFDGAGKQPMPGVVRKITDNKVTVDFNHPLAGQAVTFKVKVIAVEDATVSNSIPLRHA